MKSFNKQFLFAFFWLACLLCSAMDVNAQQTVFNVPTSDVLERGKVYFELDASFKFNDQTAQQRFSSFVPRLVVGAGKNVEIGINAIGNINPGRDSTAFVPAIKWRLYNNEKSALRIVVGDNLFVPVHNRTYKAGNYLYAQASKTINGKTRVTAGNYYFTKNVVAPNAARVGGQFAVEQTITKKINLNADYFTGKHALGYFTFGIAYKVTGKATAYVGYSLGNANLKKGNHFFYCEFGYNFN